MAIEDEFAADTRAMERIATAFETIADTLDAMYKLQQERFDREYPTRFPKDAVVTRLPTEEEKLARAQGATGESSLDEWMQIGPREREIIEESRKGAKPVIEKPKKRSS